MSTRPKGAFGALAFAIVLAAGPAAAAGTTFTVEPVRIFLQQDVRTSLLTIRNQSQEPLRLQARAYVWTEDPDGESRLEPTDDLVVFPSLISIPAGGLRKLRIGTQVLPTTEERTYRIFVEELPPLSKKDDGGPQIKVLLRMGIPIFVTPAGAKPEPAIGGLTVEGARVKLALKNRGAAHTRSKLVRIRAEDLDGNKLYEQSLPAWYLLPGGERHYEVELPPAVCAKVAVVSAEVETEAASLEAAVDATPARCNH